jgi:hypothetical protein
MAKSENGSVAWVQPVAYFATVDKDGAGKFIRIPDMPELATVAEAHGPDAADKLHDMIVRAFNAGYKEAGRDRVSLFEKTFAAADSVRKYIRDAATAKGVTNPSEEAITNTILSDKYRNVLMVKFGDEVASAGYIPAKRGSGGGATAELGDLGDL